MFTEMMMSASGGGTELTETVAFFIAGSSVYNLRYYNAQDNSYKAANGGASYTGSAKITGENIEINYTGGHNMSIKSMNGYHLVNLSTMTDLGADYTWTTTSAYSSGYSYNVLAAIKDAPTDAS